MKIKITFPILCVITVYQYMISPYIGRRCRFYPSCSEYAYSAFNNYGFFKGFTLAILRILRCNPFSKGGFDPIP
ncbi:MAG: membrane protein insertion efficiency factor YidD [bacterium]